MPIYTGGVKIQWLLLVGVLAGADWIEPLSSSQRLLAEVLRDHGYATGGFAANLNYASYESGLARGFGPLARREPLAALVAGAAPAYRVAVLRLAGIDDAGVFVATGRASHTHKIWAKGAQNLVADARRPRR